jgi:hypothetical protein
MWNDILILITRKQYNVDVYWFNVCEGEPGSSVNIVSGYGLDDRAIEVWSLAQAKGYFL